MKLFDNISLWTQVFTRQCFYIMFIFVIINILLRYVLNINFIFMQEIVMYMHAFIFLFGISLCFKDDKHVRIDVFSSKITHRVKLKIERFGLIFLVIPFCIFVIYESTPMIYRSWNMLEGSSEPGGLPFVYILKSSIYFFSILILLQALKRLIEIK